MPKSKTSPAPKRALVTGLILGLLVTGLIFVANAFLPIATGYNAKIMCSCVFVAERTAESARAADLKAYQAYVNTSVNIEEKYAEASSFGMFSRIAAYRPGLGCALLSGRERKAVQARKRQQSRSRNITSASSDINWQPADSLVSGVDKIRLETALDKAFADPNPELLQNTRAVVVLHEGKMLTERYAEGFDSSTRLLGWSMAKSVTATLVGMLVKAGKLDIMAPAPVAAWKNEEDPRGAITIDQLLRMSDGLDFDEVYSLPSNATKMLFNEPSAGEYAATVALGHEPDTKWNYSSGSSNILSRIVRDQFETDEAYYSFVYDSLFAEIGMTTAVFEPDADGTLVGSSFLYASARDWARFGQLYLQDGIWEGKRLLPEGWADYVSTRTPTAPHGEYGAHFWMNATSSTPEWPMERQWPGVPQDAYYASGFEGQYVVIMPTLDLVVVRLGLTSDRKAWDLGAFLTNVIAALPQE